MKLKKWMSLMLALVMALALAVPAMAGADFPNLNAVGKDGTDITYSKYGESGWSKWNDVIFLGDANADSTDKEVSAWHIVIKHLPEENPASAIQDITINFEYGTYQWDGRLSTNDGGKNPGLMLVSPKSWGEITGGQIQANSSVSVFNISGYYKAGTPTTPDDDDGIVSANITVYKEVKGDENLAGFEFAIFDAEDNRVSDIDSVKSDEYGTVSFKDVDLTVDATYTIKEINQDLDKYEANTQEITFTVDKNGEVTFTSVDDNGLELSTFTNVYKLVPVQFDVTKAVVGSTDLSGFTFALLDGETQVATAATDAEGKASFDTELEPGTYTVKEISQDTANYVENAESYTVVVGEDRTVTVNNGEPVAFTNYKLGELNVTVPTEAYQQQIKQVHATAYEVFSEGTLVSHIASVSGAKLPEGVTGSYLKNGMTYLTIDKAKLEAAGTDGVTIGIAASDPEKGNKTSWNTPAPAPRGENDQPTYNLKIEDSKLVVTSELPNIGVCLYSTEKTTVTERVTTGKGKNKVTETVIKEVEAEPVNGPQDVKHLTGVKTASFDIPEGETFKFFLHIEDTEYETNKKIGCKLVSSEILENKLEDAAVTTVITDEQGETVEAGKLPAGEYTVTVTVSYGDGKTCTWTQKVTVEWGETASAAFDKLVVSEMAEPIIECPENCGTVKAIPLTPATLVEDENA